MSVSGVTSWVAVSAGVDDGEAGLGEDVEAEVAAALDPVVVLLGEHGADQPDQGGSVGEDADHVGAAADLAVEAFLGVVGPDLAPDLLRKRGEREHVGAGGLEMVNHGGQPVGQHVEHPVELLVHGLSVGMVVDRAAFAPTASWPSG
jgi:hypothetical protein